MKRKVLDMGAGIRPHSGATHAVDLAPMVSITKELVVDNYNDLKRIPSKESVERRLKSMDYKFNFNYNTNKLPWPNNSFKLVYSNGSLGENGKLSAFKEIYRVLKHGGKLSYGMIGGPEENIKRKMKILYDVGFKNIKPIVYVNPKNKNDISAWMTAVKP